MRGQWRVVASSGHMRMRQPDNLTERIKPLLLFVLNYVHAQNEQQVCFAKLKKNAPGELIFFRYRVLNVKTYLFTSSIVPLVVLLTSFKSEGKS